MVSGTCPSEADAVQGVVDIVLWRDGIGELNEGQLFEDIVSGEKGKLCEAEKTGESGDPKSGAGARRAGSGDEIVRMLWGF